jgi:hypothetical protein
VFAKLDEKFSPLRESRKARIQDLLEKGYVIPKSEDHARELIGKELTKELGSPDESSLSPSKYWFTQNGRSIRVSNHTPIYFFEDSGVNIVPGSYNENGTDVIIKSGTPINPREIAKSAIERNRKLPAVDAKKALERVSR